MTIGIKARSQAYLAAARQIREIDRSGAPEPDRIAAVVEVLKDLAADKALFPLHAFPRVEGSPGGLYRLAGFPDQRGAVYMSLGFVGRKQSPHNHVSWAAVVGVDGGRETNVLYEKIDGDEPGKARLIKRDEVPVGPGDAVSLPSGFYHTIEVDSGPSLHLHAYSYDVDAPGFTTYGFESPDAETYTGRATGGFRPPLSAVTDGDIAGDLESGDVVLLVLDGRPPVGLEGRILHAEPGKAEEALAAANVPTETPVILAGENVLDVGVALFAAGRPLVFEYRKAA